MVDCFYAERKNENNDSSKFYVVPFVCSGEILIINEEKSFVCFDVEQKKIHLLK